MARKITLQTIFNKAYRHFVLKKGKPCALNHKSKISGNPVFQCRYKWRGRKCAIGLALPEGHPSQKSQCPLDNLVDKWPELFSDDIVKLREANNLALARFQSDLHDTHINKDTLDWKEGVDLKQQYLKVAEDFNLTVPTR